MIAAQMQSKCFGATSIDFSNVKKEPLTSENKGPFVFVWAKHRPLWARRRIANVVHQVLHNIFVRQEKEKLLLSEKMKGGWVVYLFWVLINKLLWSMGLQREDLEVSQNLICCWLEAIFFAEYSPERMELILQNPSLPLLFPLSTQNMDHMEMSCTLHSTRAMSAFTYPHICSPHIFHGQGQCPGKSSHSSDSSPGGMNQVWELDMNLMIFTAHCC